MEEFNSKASLRKRRVKRRSKDDISKSNNNVSDSEIHRTKTERNRKSRSIKYSKRMCFSAADYIGKSHEELILMLIKLRRRQSELSKSCEQLRIQMESEAKMMEFEPHKKDEYNYRVKELKQKLSKVEQEYECQLPMINSIDSMIKIKSGGLHQPSGITSLISSSNESPKHLPISSPTKSIDTGIDMIKVISSPSDQSISTPSDNIENLKHQQKALANELDRVRGLLTHSTKKLEEKAVENAQMEQEMLVARNKLKQVLETEQEAMEISRSSKLESELAHINRVIDDLHSRRKELNTAIENLKNNSNDSNGYSDSYRSTQTKSSIQQYREAILSSSNIVPPPPLYENLSTRSYNEDQDESSSNGSRVQLFDQVNNNNNNNRKDNDNENDEFFTLNINLNKAKYQMKQPNTNTTTTELNGVDCSEINNNDSNNFNLNSTSSTNSMCEFDPTKDLQQMMMTYGDSIVDQQIKQIYNYQQQQLALKATSEIPKTVREVKRESERRKYQQQKLLQQQQQLRSLNQQQQQSFYLLSNHYYNGDSQEITSTNLSDSIGLPLLNQFDELNISSPSSTSTTTPSSYGIGNSIDNSQVSLY